MIKLNVLSLFDGMSCGRVALDRAGIDVNNYYASEIDKYASAVSRARYPDIKHLGDVTKWKDWDIDWSSIDLLIGGSPCQGFSMAGKQLNFNDPRSKLFFEYVDILNHIKEVNPKVLFLLENVKMKSEFRDIISGYLHIEPIEIDSALVSAQRRKRLYWTNIEGVEQPEDKGILLKDIVHEHTDMDNAVSDSWLKWFGKRSEMLTYKSFVAINPEKAVTMTARQFASWHGNFIFECLADYIVDFDDTLKILDTEVKKGKIGYFNSDSQGNRIYQIHDKSITLTSNAGGEAGKTGMYLFGCLTPNRINKRQNGQRFNDGNKFYTLTVQDNHGILTEGYIRKLTPIECERLQTLPDDYTLAYIKDKPISDCQRYKMLGNGWTVDVIAHILKNIKRCRDD